MKRFWITLLALAIMALPVLAGPTIGLGVGFLPDITYYAPCVGMQWNHSPIGLETNLSFTLIQLAGGTFEDLDYALGGFWEIVNLTVPVMNGMNGGVFGFLGGVGTPFILEGDGNEFAIVGGNLGAQFGFFLESNNGSGLTVLGWWNGDLIGVGCRLTGDLFSEPIGAE